MQTALPQDPCLCIRMRRAAQRITDYYDKTLLPSGISVNQYSLLINIARLGECGTGELAEKVGLEKSTLVRTLKPLLMAELIADASPTESRKRRLSLTPKGEHTLQQAIPLWQQAQNKFKQQLGEEYQSLMGFFNTANTL